MSWCAFSKKIGYGDAYSGLESMKKVMQLQSLTCTPMCTKIIRNTH